MDDRNVCLWIVFFILLIIIAIIFRRIILPRLNKKGVTIIRVIGVVAVAFMILYSCFLIFIQSNGTSEEAWHIEYMQYDELHKYSVGGSQTIALIDSGISEVQAKDKRVLAVNHLQGGSDYDDNGHGTMMCSLIHGCKYFEGISPQSTIISYKIVGEDGIVDGKLLASAIRQASKHADIINISMGSYHNDPTVEEAVKEAIGEGIIIVASSGDYEGDDMLYPAGYEDVIAVGAIKENLKAWEDTNAISQCDILAPGKNVLVQDISNSPQITNGTSQATALISGYIALIKDYAEENGVKIDCEGIKKILTEVNSGEKNYLEALRSIGEV